MQIDHSSAQRPTPEPLGPTPAGRAEQEAARRRDALKLHSPGPQQNDAEPTKVGRNLNAKA